MYCISPLKASFDNNGDITYSSKKAINGLVGFQFDCRRCLPCRLKNARDKAIRCYHEAQLHENNIFLTLTYSDENLVSDKLDRRDIQLFIKKLREKHNRNNDEKITVMYTGEYGEETKRPHWHLIIFNYRPTDAQKKLTTERGDTLYVSREIDELWNKGMHDFGEVTLDSANYVARYAAKKLVHGNDQDHDYHPIHQTPRNGMGKGWIEKYWKYTFQNGYIVLPNGQTTAIPRYYVEWLQKNKPYEYVKYKTTVRNKIILDTEKKARKEEMDYLASCFTRNALGKSLPISRPKVKLTILESKFKNLQENLKL